MKRVKFNLNFLVFILALFSCKKSDENINYSNIENYNYKFLISSDNRVKEIVISSNNSIRYKLAFQYFNKYFVQNTYWSNNDLALSKYYYFNDSNRIDSSIFFDFTTSSKYLDDTTYSSYKYYQSLISEIDYVRFYSSVQLTSSGNKDTIRNKESGFLSFECRDNRIISDMKGSSYVYTNIENKLGISIINFDHRNYADFGFNTQYFGDQEDNLIGMIQYYDSERNVTKFAYTLDPKGYISKIEKTYPLFNYQTYEIVYYKDVYNFTYNFE
jgi:hypothetical protein